MRTLILAALVAIAVFSSTLTDALAGDPPAVVAPAAVPAATAKVDKPIYDEAADANAEIAAALARAKRNNTRVLVQWGANWCGWCKWLHKTCKDDTNIALELRNEYEVVLVDIGRMDKHSELTAKYGADLKKNGVPFLTVLAADGSVIVNQETASLEKPAGVEPKGHDVVKLLAFLTANQAPAINASDALAASIKMASAEDKLVFLHFGAPWCGWCHRLENWMANPEVAAILSKAFVDVKIDTDRMIGGQELLDAHSKGKSGGIPWCEMLDSKGVALVNSNGPGGNIGFPAAPEEIAWFVEMLKKSGAKLSADDIALLAASLTPPPKAAPTAPVAAPANAAH